jgi:hypothetical protein
VKPVAKVKKDPWAVSLEADQRRAKRDATLNGD